MSNIIIRRNNKFCINESALKPKANKTNIHAALLGAVYLEFRGASTNLIYKDLSPLERFNKLNEFARNWLKERGLE